MIHRLLKQTETALADRELAAATGLRLAQRLEKARREASESDSGLFEIARDRVIVHLLRTRTDTLRVQVDKDSPHIIVVRGPVKKRAPAARIALDRVPAELRADFDLLAALPEEEEERVFGLEVHGVDPAFRSLFDGMSPAELSEAAHEAEEQYDYERAVSAWRLAVLHSKGAPELVRELARFLAELYGDYEELADLLASDALDLEGDYPLTHRLADALYQCGRKDEARDIYERLVGKGDEQAVVLRRLGHLEMQAGELLAAATHLAESVATDPTSTAARQLLEEVQRAQKDRAETTLAEAEVAYEAGDPARAQALCGQLRAAGSRSRALAALEARLLAAEAAQAAGAWIEAAEAMREAEDWRGVLSALAEARSLAPAVADAQHVMAGEARRHLADASCRTHVETALSREAQGDLDGAVLSWGRAIATGVGFEAASTLGARLVRFCAHHGGAAPNERQRAGLAALHRAIAALEAADLTLAATHLVDAKRGLDSTSELDEAQARLDALLGAARRAEASRWRAAAEAYQADGALDKAVAALEKAEGLGAAVGEAIKALRATIEQDAERQRRRELLERLAKEGHWWRLREALCAQPEEGLEGLLAQAEREVRDRWAISPVAPKPDVGLDFEALDLPADTAISLDEGTGRLALYGGNRLVVAALGEGHETLEAAAVLCLPEALAARPGLRRAFPTATGDTLVVDFEALTGWRVGDDGRLKTRMELAIPSGNDPKRLAAETAFDSGRDRLVTLLTGQRGRYKGRLLALDATTGRVSAEEGFSFPVYNLKPVAGAAGRFAVQRPFDARALTPGFYNFAVVDGRARIQDRVKLDVPEPMHALRRLVVAPSVGASFAQYWFLDPFSGQVLESSMAFAHLRPDWSVRYQVTEPGDWLEQSQVPTGAFAFHEPSGLLLVPFRDGAGCEGLGAVDTHRYQCEWSLDFPEGTQLRGLYDHLPTQSVLTLTQTGERRVVRQVDVNALR